MTGLDMRAVILGLIKENTLDIQEHVVSAVGDDNTVSLGFGDSTIPDVPCSSAYPIRKRGDKVLVARLGSSNWHVFAKAESTASDGAVSLRDLNDGLENVENLLLQEIPHSIKLQFGTGSAPSGFTAITGWAVSDDGDGNFRLWAKVGTAMTASQRQSASVKPRSVVIDPAQLGSWTGTGAVDSTIWQGGTDTKWTGAWFYGSDIQDACAGKVVAAIKINLARSSEVGPDRVPVRLYLHGLASRAKPPLIAGPVVPATLEVNEFTSYQLPDSWVSMLKSGAAKGFAVYAEDDLYYLGLGGTSGRVTIDFAAS